jgi:hypothetical protein
MILVQDAPLFFFMRQSRMYEDNRGTTAKNNI